MKESVYSSKWKTIKSTYVVNDRWLKLRADACQLPDGKVIEPWYVLEYPEWVNCLVFDENDEVVLLKHYRHGIDDEVLEIVAGIADADDESTTKTIARELEEEIGLKGSSIFKTGVVYANPSNQNNKVHCYVALGGSFAGQRLDEHGAAFSQIRMPFEEFYGLVTSTESAHVFQGLHIASIFYALNFIKHADVDNDQIKRLRARIT